MVAVGAGRFARSAKTHKHDCAVAGIWCRGCCKHELTFSMKENHEIVFQVTEGCRLKDALLDARQAAREICGHESRGENELEYLIRVLV